jgi:hypothetical protein
VTAFARVRPISGRAPAPSDVGELLDERMVIMEIEMVCCGKGQQP